MSYEPNYNPDGTIKGYVQRNDAGAVTGFQESAPSPVATAPVARYVGEGGAQFQGGAAVAPPADAKISANGMYYDTAGNAYKAPTAVTRYGSPSATVGSMFGAGGAFDTTPVNETAIRDKARADVQAQIDAVNELAQSELVTASKNAEQRLGQTRALGAASGVLGSPTGEAQRQGTEVVNTQEQNAIKAATAAKIADILSGVNTRADTLVQNAKTLASGNAEKYVGFLKEQTTQAQNDFKALATGRVVLSGDQRTKLLEQTGYDPATFDALYKSIQVANTPKADIVGDPVKSGTKLIYTVKDPTSPNGLKQITLDAGVNVESGNYSITSDTNGVYLLNKDNGSYKLIGAPKVAAGTGAGGTYVPGVDKVVDAWAERIQNGNAKITEIPASQTALRNAVTLALTTSGNTLTGKPTVTELGLSAKTTAKDLLDKFNSGKGTSAVGKSAALNSFGYGLIPGTDRANFVTDFNSLKSQLSLEGVKYLKGQGQVSDAERALLAAAVTKLNLSQSEDEFKTTLQGIIDKLNGTPAASGGSNVVTAPDGTQVEITD